MARPGGGVVRVWSRLAFIASRRHAKPPVFIATVPCTSSPDEREALYRGIAEMGAGIILPSSGYDYEMKIISERFRSRIATR